MEATSSVRRQALYAALQYAGAVLELHRQARIIPGLVLACRHDNDLVFNRAYGFANLGAKTKLTPTHLFRVASHSKWFTSTALFQLIEQGKVALTDPLARHLPWLGKGAARHLRHVTIGQVLSHTGGIHRDSVEQAHWTLNGHFLDHGELRREATRHPHSPGFHGHIKYSNFGYALLGQVIESITGQSFADYLHQHILAPLGLASTHADITPATKDFHATPHGRLALDGTRPELAHIHTAEFAAATGISSTAADLCHFGAAHWAGNAALLTHASKGLMQRRNPLLKIPPSARYYGLGVMLSKVGSWNLIGHSGGFPGFVTLSLVEPKRRLSLSLLTNAIDAPIWALMEDVISWIQFFDEHWQSGKLPSAHAQLMGRSECVGHCADVIATGRRLWWVTPMDGTPQKTATPMTVVGRDKARLGKVPVLGPCDETLTFQFRRDGRPKSVRLPGHRLVFRRRLQDAGPA